jgi:hypothetical protein
VRLVAKWFLGFGGYSVATTGVILDRAGVLNVAAGIRPLLAISLVAFLSSFALSGWLNGRGRGKQSAASVSLAFFTCGFSFVVLLLGLARGNPRRFEVIEKVAAETSDGPRQRRLRWAPTTRLGSMAAATLAVGLFLVLIFSAYAERLAG